MSILLALLAGQPATGGGTYTPPPGGGSTLPTTSDPRLNTMRRDSGWWMGWAASDPDTTHAVETVEAYATGRNPSLLLAGAPSGVTYTYSNATVTHVESGATYPVTVGGQATWTTSGTLPVETDEIAMAYMDGDHFAWAADVTRSGTTLGAYPTVISLVGHSRKPSVVLIGDSNAHGPSTAPQAAMIAARVPHHNAAGAGNSSTHYSDALLRDRGAHQYHTHSHSQLGVNDLSDPAVGGTYTVQTEAEQTLRVAAILAGYGLRHAQSTIAPRVALAPGVTWDTATEADQRWYDAASDWTFQTGYNPWRRDGCPTPDGVAYAAVGTAGVLRAGDAGHPVSWVLDPAATVESSAASYKWLPLSGYTSDGTHVNVAGAAVMIPIIQAWAEGLTV